MPPVRDPAALLPLSDPVYLILLSLAGGERHGYHLMQEVERVTGGRTRMGPGTLYGALKRLLADGLIRETGAPRGARDEDSRRRYYTLTAFGHRVLQAEAARLDALVTIARERGLLPGVRPA